MTTKKILVTGVGGYWGERVSQKLTEQTAYHVIGLDTIAPEEPVPGLDFIQTDIRNPLLVELLKSEQVDIVCHLSFKESNLPSEPLFDHNVMGAMKVLGACAQSKVSKIIVMSSTAVYGAKASNPAFLTEEHPLAGNRGFGSIRDLIEIESFCNGFRGQSPEKILTVLRFANIIGSRVDSPLNNFLQDPISPSLLGFDPMMQLIHEDDVVNAIVHAVVNDINGTFNVAALDLLPLSRVMGLAGKVPLPIFHLFAYWGYSMIGGSGLRLSSHTPIELDYIRYRWVGDLHKLQTTMNFVPNFSGENALRELAEQTREKQFVHQRLSQATDVNKLKRIIERRKHDRNFDGDGLHTDVVEGKDGNGHE